MYCRVCGNPIPDDSDFCQHCGNKTYINESTDAKREPEAPLRTHIKKPENTDSKKEIKPKQNLLKRDKIFKKRPKKAIILGICACLIILLLAGVVVYESVELAHRNDTIASKDQTITSLQNQVENSISQEEYDRTVDNNLLASTIISDLQKKVYNLENKYDYVNEFVELAGVNQKNYHKLDCSYLDRSQGFYAFNPELAKSMGFSPCPYCH